MTSNERKAKISKLYESLSDTEKSQFNRIQLIRNAAVAHVIAYTILLTIFALIFLIAVTLLKAPHGIDIIPLIVIAYLILRAFYSIHVINLDQDELYSIALNLWDQGSVEK